MARISRVLSWTSAALVMCISSAYGTASTHIWAPSTDVQPYRLVHLTVDMYLPVERNAAGSQIATVTNLGATLGVLSSKVVNMEVGFDHKAGLGTLDDHPLYGNAKLGVPENALGKGAPAFAVGVFDVGTKADRTDFNVLYAMAARSFTLDGVALGRISVGYFRGNDKLLLDGEGRADEQGLLVAWERTMTEWTDKLWVCVEYMGTQSAYGTVNVGAAWKFVPTVALLGGYSAFNNDQLAGTATVQVDIDF